MIDVDLCSSRPKGLEDHLCIRIMARCFKVAQKAAVDEPC